MTRAVLVGIMKLHRALVLGATLVLAACSSACGTAVDEESAPTVAVKDLAEGLTIFKTEGMVSGAYRRADRAIYFETHRGAPISDVYKGAFPELGEYEMDIRVLDDNGRVVYIQQGGDGLPTAWERSLEREAKLPRVDALRRAEDFEMLKAWSTEFEKAELPAAVALEKATIVRTKLAVRDNMLKPAVEKAMKEVGYTPVTDQVEIHDQCIYGCIGHHSAHYLNNSGYVVNACNHGACASTMGEKCQISGTSTTYGSSNCATGYDWDSSNGHNCHDDTIRAVWGLRFGSQATSTTGVCNNSSTHWHTPDCTTTSW